MSTAQQLEENYGSKSVFARDAQGAQTSLFYHLQHAITQLRGKKENLNLRFTLYVPSSTRTTDPSATFGSAQVIFTYMPDIAHTPSNYALEKR